MGLFAFMFSLMLVLIFIGVPVGVTMFGASVFTIGILRGFADIPFAMLAQRMLYGLNNFTLLAIPIFILVGKVVNEAGITDKIFDVAKNAVGHFTGGIGHVNVLASMLFAGMSGSAVADAGGLGFLEYKAMRDEGYPEGFSAGITASSATIGPIIPPSIPMIVYGALAGVSVGNLFIAAIIPGALMGISLMIIVYIISKKKGFAKRGRSSFKEFLASFKKGFLPLMTPVIIIGGIFSGQFTATEAAGASLFYALILSFFVYKSLTIKKLIQVLKETMIDSAILLFIIAAASLFSWVLARYQVSMELSMFIQEIIQSKTALLIVVNIFLLIVGGFIDSVPALMLLTPTLVPLVQMYGVHPLHFGVVMVLNLMIGLITPPLGTVLYTTHQVTKVSIENIIKGVAPFYIPLIIVLILITFFPEIVMFLPRTFLW